MTDYRAAAKAWKLAIPEEQLEKIVPVLEGLEQSFRPLAAKLAFTAEPAIIFVPAGEVQ